MIRKATIKDIAKASGVSTTAVSLVLNNRPNRVSEDVKSLIIENVSKMNYSPNTYARSLVTKSSKTIGLIIPDIENAFFSAMSKAVGEYARQKGYLVILLNSNDEHAQTLDSIKLLYQRNIDGIMIVVDKESYYDRYQEEIKKVLGGIGIPFVLLDRFIEDFDSNMVYFDNELGGYLATKRLLDNGHKKIACISGPSKIPGSYARLCGYKRAMTEAHLEINEELIKEGDYRLLSGIQSMKELEGQDFTAIFACNDLMAFGAIEYLHSIGKSVPKDYSIVGYDNYTVFTKMENSLDSIDQNSNTLGQQGCSLLLDLISGKENNIKKIKLIPQLVIKNSVKKIH